jgi:hypothetical protein
MTKDNYVKKYSLQDRCYNGRIPSPGSMIDESSARPAFRIIGCEIDTSAKT